MAGITLAQAESALQYWLDADARLAAGESFSISVGGSSRSATRADTMDKIQYWDKKVKSLTRGSSVRVMNCVPKD